MRKPVTIARTVTILILAASACGSPDSERAEEQIATTTGTPSLSDGPPSVTMRPMPTGPQSQSRERTRRGAVMGSVGSGADGGAAMASAATGSAATANAAAPAAPRPVAEIAADADGSQSQMVRGGPLVSSDATGAMLVRQGQASIEVARLDDAVARVRQAAAQYRGFVANTAVTSGKDERRAASIELRVPTDQFDALLASLNSLGKVESVTAQVQDMSEEYVDLGARLANARRVEARLIEMLATRTGKLSDVLTVEQELARVRMEAERYEARIRWIERKAALSSLSVTIHEKLPLIDTRRGPGPIAVALADAWSHAVGVLAWFIASLGILIPLGLLIGAGYLMARRLLRRRTPPGVSEA